VGAIQNEKGRKKGPKIVKVGKAKQKNNLYFVCFPRVKIPLGARQGRELKPGKVKPRAKSTMTTYDE